MGAEHAGRAVHGWLFSDPVFLGAATVSAEGTAEFTVPADVPAGEHRLAVTAADGTLLGWDTLMILAPTGPAPAPSGLGSLPSTGAGQIGLLLTAAALVVAGLVLVRRRAQPLG
ncbi:LPXTG cell wall anchor domain-containing protein [Georgenia sp. SUBG003]|uniref:LPXTG cell wall anchor domain-containing protein n=1 Tax=Georgenia sp. SUBG003 TaxID=1497974 RepID=UPI003AB44C93